MDIVTKVEDGRRDYVERREAFALRLAAMHAYYAANPNPEAEDLLDKLHKAASKADEKGSAFFGVDRIQIGDGGIVPFSGGDGK